MMDGTITISTTTTAIRPVFMGLFSDAVRSAIRDVYGPLRGAAKALARDASHGPHQVSDRTAQEWLRGATTPGVDSIEILAARNAALRQKLAIERAALHAAISESLVRDTARNRAKVPSI